MKYLVMMNGCGAFGYGDGKNEAIDKAMRYIDEDSEIIVDVEYDGKCVGDASIYVVECPDDELFQYAINDGSMCYYDEKLKKLCKG